MLHFSLLFEASQLISPFLSKQEQYIPFSFFLFDVPRQLSSAGGGQACHVMWWLALNCEMQVLLGLKTVFQSLECIGSLVWAPKDISFFPQFPNFAVLLQYSLVPIVKSIKDHFWLILGIFLNYPNSSLLLEFMIAINILSRVWIWDPIDMLPQSPDPLN